nr:hypothetical protein [Azospirillum picis]
MPINSERLRTAPSVERHAPSRHDDDHVRTVDCVTAILVFVTAVLLALLALSANWNETSPESRLRAYENTPVMVILPNPR